MERVAEVVKRLDVQSGPLTSIFRVYPLKHGSAAQLAARIPSGHHVTADRQRLQQVLSSWT